ncbi:hypothetical protein NRB56_28710 [Nocardia sp. RB56]|uniref:Uncharacterized protein n=1 Tax=Nocardia aurantia TaxID=2585199 RepID=A0A7K0DNV5_9NOCA|nr:hypothetical protein [Nocardia aurantia]
MHGCGADRRGGLTYRWSTSDDSIYGTDSKTLP